MLSRCSGPDLYLQAKLILIMRGKANKSLLINTFHRAKQALLNATESTECDTVVDVEFPSPAVVVFVRICFLQTPLVVMNVCGGNSAIDAVSYSACSSMVFFFFFFAAVPPSCLFLYSTHEHQKKG